MQQEAYDLLVEADACEQLERSPEEWRFMCVKLLVILAETKDNAAEMLLSLSKMKNVKVEEESIKALPSLSSRLAEPPFESDFFNQQRKDF